MFQCPNCGGNARFDIPSQMLSCDYCNTKVDPYSYENKTSDAQEGTDPENYEVTIFTCPQCGGEILSTDNAAAGFCSFCGASTILYSRISQEHRPNYIIPFKKTKEDCKIAYSSMMKKAIFAPNELKDPKKIDSFRGIYMPYWAFYEAQQGPVNLTAEKSHRSGDYIITDHYKLSGEIDAYYKGLSYDASSSFADNISEAIAPYDVKGMKAFTPAFLSGFYADTADVSAEVYRPDAEMVAFDQSLSKLKSVPEFRGYSLDTSKVGSPERLHTVTAGVDQAMFPVWFMSYRNGDRVAYATVNGQTGKVVADIPVDIKKFLLGSLILALPIFLLLNLFFTVIPSSTLKVTGVLAVIAMILSCVTIGKIVKRENNEDDRGLLSIKNPQKLAEINRTLKPKLTKEKSKSGNIVKIIALIYLCSIVATTFGTLFFEILEGSLSWIAIQAVGFAVAIIAFGKIGQVPGKKGMIGLILTIAGMIAGSGVVLFHPVSDWWYYVAAIILIAGVIVMETELMLQYNLTATRRLPQFDKEGGDDRA